MTSSLCIHYRIVYCNVYILYYTSPGYGSTLMQHCIKLASSLSMEELYLSTKDKMGFYARLGFTSSTAVSILSKVNVIFRGKHSLVTASAGLPGVEWMSKDLVNL